MPRQKSINYEEERLYCHLQSKMMNPANRLTDNDKFNKTAEQWHRSAPTMSKFDANKNINGIYPHSEIMTDIKKVLSIEKELNFSETQINIEKATAAEITFLEGVLNYNWLGESIIPSETSRYDDYVNHIDCTITHHDYDEPENDFVLGIDITISKDEKEIINKVFLNRDKLDTDFTSEQNYTNALHEIKYYEDPDNISVRGRIFIPRIIINMEVEDVNELMERFVCQDETIQDDPIKDEIIYQIIGQLEESVAFLINKYLNNEFKTNSNNWKNELTINTDKINNIPGLEKLLNKYTKPLNYFKKIQKEHY